MRKKTFYHSLTNSFDNPQIVEHDLSGFRGYLPGIEHGPYPTFAAAKRDMISSIRADIQKLENLLKNVRKLRDEK